jgi:hypothetical protein
MLRIELLTFFGSGVTSKSGFLPAAGAGACFGALDDDDVAAAFAFSAGLADACDM